jgi:hypothetical protein
MKATCRRTRARIKTTPALEHMVTRATAAPALADKEAVRMEDAAVKDGTLPSLKGNSARAVCGAPPSLEDNQALATGGATPALEGKVTAKRVDNNFNGLFVE